MDERITKLIELKALIESGSENWDQILALELYFYGSNMTSCRCKTATVRSKLNQYFQQYKGEIPNEQ